jgi:hypothetical protein
MWYKSRMNPPPRLAIQVFETMVMSVALYGSELLSPLTMTRTNKTLKEISKVQLAAYKKALGLPAKASTAFVLGEVGQLLFSDRVRQRSLIYYNKITGRINKTGLIATAVKIQSEVLNSKARTWGASIHKMVAELDLNLPTAMKDIKESILEAVVRQWQGDLSENSKLDLYRKTAPGYHTKGYLNISNKAHRSALLLFLASFHHLAIETGRRSDIPRESRFCSVCRNKVDDELHALLECPLYASARAKFIKALGIQGDLDEDNLLSHLLSTTMSFWKTFAEFCLSIQTISKAQYSITSNS